MKILVVEDEKGTAQVLRRGLQEDNHAVSLAHDGPSALSLAQDTQFDLVLLDVMLPGINGIQVARRFRELRQDIAAQLKSRVRSATAPSFVLLCPWQRIASPFLPSHMQCHSP